jgi:Protein of unknown function (DUF3567)
MGVVMAVNASAAEAFETLMQTIYNSPLFCVVEFSGFGAEGQHPAGGFEIMDKALRREIFLGGKDAEQFRSSVQALIASQPAAEDLDDFLAAYAGVMTTPVALH